MKSTSLGVISPEWVTQDSSCVKGLLPFSLLASNAVLEQNLCEVRFLPLEWNLPQALFCLGWGQRERNIDFAVPLIYAFIG